MKRKWLSILLVGAMTLSLAACGSSDSKDEKKSEEGGHKFPIFRTSYSSRITTSTDM